MRAPCHDCPFSDRGDWVMYRDEYEALVSERDRYRDALQEIASDLGTPGTPEWRCAMESLGLDADAAERAWQS